ncbi:MAG: hypothetical protein LBJ23_05375 [Tannerella sp.]|jgi:hypothetical protein|nr:hypothetical protein [Tannerella sp.]
MKRKRYIPSREAEFYPWSKNLVDVSQSKGAQWEIPAMRIQNLGASFKNFELKYLIALDPATRTKITVQDKNGAKKSFTVDLRDFCQGNLLHNALVTDADRDLLRLPIPDRTPTHIPPPSGTPSGRVDTAVHQRHTVHVVDTQEIRPRGGLPDGVYGFETWRGTGSEMPTDDSGFTYLNTSTTTSLAIEYALSEVGKNVWYRFRWVNARNQPGPWSEIICAVIP